MALQPGFNCKLYRLSTGTRASAGAASSGIVTAAAPANLNLVDQIENLKLDVESDAIEANIRSLAPYKTSIMGLIKVEVEFNFKFNTTADADYQAFRGAFLTQANIACAILTGASTTSGSEGWWADFIVTAFPREEEINGIVDVPVKLTLSSSTSVPPEYLVIS